MQRVAPAGASPLSLAAVGSFSGAYPPAVIDAAKAGAEAVSIAQFTVVLGGEGVVGLEHLQQALSLAMTKAGVGIRQKGRFAPHMTMMYGDRVDEFSIEPISWRVEQFALVDSLYAQSKHMLLGRWPF